MKTTIITLTALMIFLGCISSTTEPSCERPYSFIAEKCCLDQNMDKMCDIDRPICDEPYINYANDCCLDQNEDRICDSHQTTSQQMTTTTRPPFVQTTRDPTTTLISTTTSTIPENGCMSLDDCELVEKIGCDTKGRKIIITTSPISCTDNRCVSKTSKGIASYSCETNYKCVPELGCVREDLHTTTSTTLEYDYDFQAIIDRIRNKVRMTTTTTTTTIPECIDSDGGSRIDKKSSLVSGMLQINDTIIYSTEESCRGEKHLLEYWCESTKLKSRIIECENQCEDGICCRSTSRTCLSADECCSGICQAIGISMHCL